MKQRDFCQCCFIAKTWRLDWTYSFSLESPFLLPQDASCLLPRRITEMQLHFAFWEMGKGLKSDRLWCRANQEMNQRLDCLGHIKNNE